jgi:hypothetical protein
MSDALNRAERCRDLAEKCRREAAICTSTEMRNHHLRMEEHYSILAQAEELAALQRFPVDLIHAVVMRGLDPRITHLCKIYAKRMDPRAAAVDGVLPRPQEPNGRHLAHAYR